MNPKAILLLNSITDLRAEHAGQIALSGSHGGLYPATLASNGGLRAVVFNDAGIGFQRAGVSGLVALEKICMAAAAVDCMTGAIGSAADMLATGRISAANAPAFALGVRIGMTAVEAAGYLDAAAMPETRLEAGTEARRELPLSPDGPVLSLVDSASLVNQSDIGAIVVTGSHGGLIGGDPSRALKAKARIAVFNDAGGGKDGIGTTRLPTLQRNGIAAVTVSHASARIGDARSTFETGEISACNAIATELGAARGRLLKDWLMECTHAAGTPSPQRG